MLFLKSDPDLAVVSKEVISRLQNYGLESFYWEDLFYRTLERIFNCNRQVIVSKILTAYCGRHELSLLTMVSATDFDAYIRTKISNEWKEFFFVYIQDNRQPWFTFPVSSASFALSLARQCDSTEDGAIYEIYSDLGNQMEDTIPSCEIARLEDLPQIQTLVAADTVKELVKMILDTFFSEGVPMSPLELKFIAESMSCHSVGYIETALHFSKIDSCQFWRVNKATHDHLGFWFISEQASIIAQEIEGPGLVVINEVRYESALIQHTMAPVLEEVILCMDAYALSDVAPLLCKKLFVMVTGSSIPLHFYVPGTDIGTFHFGRAPLNELRGSLTIEDSNGRTPLIQISPHITRTFVYVRIPYELVDKHWYASLFGPSTDYPGYSLFRALRPVVIANNRFTITVRLDISRIPPNGSLWIACFNDELELCGGSAIPLTLSVIDVSICSSSGAPVSIPRYTMNLLKVLCDTEFVSKKTPVCLSRSNSVCGQKAMILAMAYDCLPCGFSGVEVDDQTLTNAEIEYLAPPVVSGYYRTRRVWGCRRQTPMEKTRKKIKRQMDISKDAPWLGKDMQFGSSMMKIKPYASVKGQVMTQNDMIYYGSEFYHYCAIHKKGPKNLKNNSSCKCDDCSSYFPQEQSGDQMDTQM